MRPARCCFEDKKVRDVSFSNVWNSDKNLVMMPLHVHWPFLGISLAGPWVWVDQGDRNRSPLLADHEAGPRHSLTCTPTHLLHSALLSQQPAAAICCHTLTFSFFRGEDFRANEDHHVIYEIDRWASDARMISAPRDWNFADITVHGFNKILYSDHL